MTRTRKKSYCSAIFFSNFLFKVKYRVLWKCLKSLKTRKARGGGGAYIVGGGGIIGCNFGLHSGRWAYHWGAYKWGVGA